MAQGSAKVAPVSAPEVVVDHDDAGGSGETLRQQSGVVALNDPFRFGDCGIVERCELVVWPLYPICVGQVAKKVDVQGRDAELVAKSDS
jgi:hypothetical protein